MAEHDNDDDYNNSLSTAIGTKKKKKQSAKFYRFCCARIVLCVLWSRH